MENTLYALPAPIPDATAENTAFADAMNQIIHKDVDDGLAACAAVRVICRDKLIYKTDYGMADVENKIPLNDRHLFRLASMTKPITGVCIMQLVEQGKLSLDDPAEKYIPAFKDMVVAEYDSEEHLTGMHPSSRPFTIRDLLSHSSGVGSGPGFRRPDRPQKPLPPNYTLADVMDNWADECMAFDPGTNTTYSWLMGFDILARIVEIISGMTFEEYTREKLFLPLNMKDACFRPTEEQWGRMTELYRRNKDTVFEHVEMGRHFFYGTPLSYFSGSGTVGCTADDYARFAHMLGSDGISGGVRILSEDSVRQMRTPQILCADSGNTLSWGLSMRVIVMDNSALAPRKARSFGWSGAYGTHFFCDPDRQISAVYCTGMLDCGGSWSLTSRHFENAIMDHFDKIV